MRLKFLKGCKSKKIRGSRKKQFDCKKNGVDLSSAVFLERMITPAEFRTVALFFKNETAVKHCHHQHGCKQQEDSSEFHWTKDKCITMRGCDCLQQIFQTVLLRIFSR